MKRTIAYVLTAILMMCLLTSCGSKGIDQNYGMTKFAECDGVKVYYQKDGEWAEYVAKHIREDADDFFQKTKISPDVEIFMFDKKEDFLKNMKTELVQGMDRYYIIDKIEPNKLIAVDIDDADALNQETTYIYTCLNYVTADKIGENYKDISTWLGNGMSIYFSYGDDVERIALMHLSGKKAVISYEDTKKEPSPTDSTYYSFSQLYFKYLMDTYGWDKCETLVKTMNYEEAFGKTEEEIYEEWKTYLQNTERFRVIFS